MTSSRNALIPRFMGPALGLLVLVTCWAILSLGHHAGVTLPRAAAQEDDGNGAQENAGQDDLDRAMEMKLAAQSIMDLSSVIRLAQSAIDKGLNEDNRQFAEQLVASTRYQRGSLIAENILDAPGMQWSQLRRLAMADLEASLDLNAEQPRAWLLIAQLQLLPDGDKPTAVKAIDRAIESSEDDPRVRAEAYALRAAKVETDPKKQRESLNKAVEISPENPDVLHARAAFLSDVAGEHEKALEDLEKLIELEPEEPRHHESLGIVLGKLERYDEAKAALERARQLAPNSVSPLVQQARILAEQEQYEAAIDVLDSAHAIEPANIGVLLLRSSVYQAMEETEKALDDLDRVLTINPDMSLALRLRSSLLAGEGQFDEALSDLRKLETEAAEDPSLLLQLGLLYNAVDQTQKAIDAFSEYLADQPDDLIALRGRADAYLGLGQHAEAIEDYEKALEINPDDSGVLNNLAWVLATSTYDKLRNGKRAIELATKACELTDYEAAHILSTLAAAYAETGDFESARKWAKKAVETDDGEHGDALQKELASYQKNEPWRENLAEEDENDEPTESASDDDEDAAPSQEKQPSEATGDEE